MMRLCWVGTLHTRRNSEKNTGTRGENCTGDDGDDVRIFFPRSENITVLRSRQERMTTHIAAKLSAHIIINTLLKNNVILITGNQTAVRTLGLINNCPNMNEKNRRELPPKITWLNRTILGCVNPWTYYWAVMQLLAGSYDFFIQYETTDQQDTERINNSSIPGTWYQYA